MTTEHNKGKRQGRTTASAVSRFLRRQGYAVLYSESTGHAGEGIRVSGLSRTPMGRYPGSPDVQVDVRWFGDYFSEAKALELIEELALVLSERFDVERRSIRTSLLIRKKTS